MLNGVFAPSELGGGEVADLILALPHSEESALCKGAISQHFRESCKLASSTLTKGWASILSKLFLED